jgi:bis(5'-nucleosyl)-tetraphosphatase (symmetrical)
VAIYAIGDVQGCYAELNRLLEKINFDPAADRLWFCGDLVNRGPQSLQTLQFVKSLGDRAICVLGNHDLHLLALHHGVDRVRDVSSLQQVLDSPERGELMAWLQRLPLLHYDESIKGLLVHAGIHPHWGLSQALRLADEVETELRGERAASFLGDMYGNKPRVWSDDLEGKRRLRMITNVFTRMRYFTPAGKLDFDVAAGPRRTQGSGLIPWFQMEATLRADVRVFFGHWSTLPVGCYGRCFALDGGCVWGGHLVALRIDHEAEDWFFVDALTTDPLNTTG